MLSKLSEEFEERNCKVLAIGLDSKMGHRSFIKDTQVRDQVQTGVVLLRYWSVHYLLTGSMKGQGGTGKGGWAIIKLY